MLRYIGILIIFSSCTFIGFYIGETYKRRYIQLCEFMKSILLLNNEVIYSHTTLPEAFINVSHKIKSPIKELYMNMGLCLREGDITNVYEAYIKYKENGENSISLDEDDEKILEHFFRNIGESLIYGQDKIFNLTIESLKNNCKRAEKNTLQNTKMFRKIGICIGAIAAIFLI